MKKSIFMGFMIILSSISSFSFVNTMNLSNLNHKGWTCQAQGRRFSGTPNNDTYQYVSGSGADKYEAHNRAISNCMGNGLQGCMIVSCYESIN